VILAHLDSGFEPVSHSGSTYVFATMGTWSDSDCRETNTIDLDPEAYLAGTFKLGNLWSFNLRTGHISATARSGETDATR
jgi:hypothetical protein